MNTTTTHNAAPSTDVVFDSAEMRFTVDANEMRLALAAIKPALPTSGALRSLSGVKVTAADGAVTVLCTDLELTMKKTIDAHVPRAGEALIPFKLVESFVKGATKTSGEVIEVSLHGIDQVAMTRGFRTREINALALDEYPRIAAFESTGMQIVDVAVFDKVLGAVATDESRPILTGVYANGDGGIVATDSYRLYLAEDVFDTDGDRMLIPSRAVQQAVKAGGEAVIEWNDREVQFSFDHGLTVTARLIEGEFPNYRGLIPASHPNAVTLNRKAAIAALKSLISGGMLEKNAPVRLSAVAGGIEFRAVHPDHGIDKATAAGAWAGDEHPLGLNPAYLLSIMQDSIDETVTICTLDSMKPVVSREGNVTRLLMPIRLS